MKINKIITEVISHVNQISEKKEYNKYIKKYPVEKMFMFLLYQQYSGIDYGRSFSLFLNHMIGDVTDVISQSELSKKLQYRLPVDLFKEMYGILLYQAKGLQSKELKKFEKMIRIIDSTALSATATMDYAKHRRYKNGFKMHTVIDDNYLPDSFVLKNGNSSDKKSLKWAIKKGYIHIFDKGYTDYQQFDWISEQEAFFVTRAHTNIRYETIRNRKVGSCQKEKGIISDRIIRVTKDRKNQEPLRLRMVTFQFIDSNDKEQTFSLLTNLFDYRSDVIADLYKERWNIEVIFRWIKSFLKIKHWMSRSKNGVLIQIYTALCAYLMALIAKIGDNKSYKIMKDSIYKYLKEFNHILQIFEPGSNIEELSLKKI